MPTQNSGLEARETEGHMMHMIRMTDEVYTSCTLVIQNI